MSCLKCVVTLFIIAAFVVNAEGHKKKDEKKDDDKTLTCPNSLETLRKLTCDKIKCAFSSGTNAECDPEKKIQELSLRCKMYILDYFHSHNCATTKYAESDVEGSMIPIAGHSKRESDSSNGGPFTFNCMKKGDCPHP